MLNIIRDNVQSFGVKFIVAIVVLVMAFFGISTYRSQSSNTVVTVDGYEVKIDRYQRAYENAREDIRNRYGAQASDYLNSINLEARIIQQLTSNALLLKSADVNGLAVSDKELAHEIYHNPAFMTDERFDVRKYEDRLNSMRIDKLGYEKDLKEVLLTNKYFRFVGMGPLFSRKSLEEEFKRFESEMTVKVIEMDPALFSDQVDVSTQELQAFYDANKTSFQQKQQFVLNYLVLDISDVKEDITVREREITRYYDNNLQSEFTTKRAFHSRHILISSPQGEDPEADEAARLKAEDLYQQLVEDGEKFAELASKHSNDPGSASNGGDLGWVEEGTFVAEFESAVQAMTPGEISRPIKTDFGYHIVELIEEKPQSVQPFSEVKATIEENIRLNKAKRRLENMVERLVSDANIQTIEQIAQSVDKTVTKTEPFDDTKDLETVGYSYQLYQELKPKGLGQIGSYALAGDQKILVYEIADIVEPFVKPLEEVKEQVEYYAKQEKLKAHAKSKLQEYSKKVKTLDAFNALANELETNIIETSFKFSDRQIAELSAGERFKVEVFKMEENQIRAIEEKEAGYLVYMVEKKQGTISEDSKETLATLENMLRRQKTELVLNGFINQLRQEIDVDYNTALLNAMNVRFDS